MTRGRISFCCFSLHAANSFIVLVGLFAGSDSNDRAILTGLRNFLRDMGGAIGTTGMIFFDLAEASESFSLISQCLALS
jgi:hypothetical protein